MLFLVKVGEVLIQTEPNTTPAKENIAANEECTVPQEKDAAHHEMGPLISEPIQEYRDSNLNNWGYKRFS